MNLEESEKWENNINTYISATGLFNFFLDDPLLDYLNKYGIDLGYHTNECPDETTKIMEKGQLFEKKVIELIRDKFIPVIEVTANSWVEGAYETYQLMKEGRPIIYQGIVINHLNKTKGHPDILIRSDYLNKLKPGLISLEEEKIPSKFGNWHYRVIDIKLSNIFLSSDGSHILNNKVYRAYKAQVLVYSLAIGLLQDYSPTTAYLLGRSSHNYDNSIYFDDCMSSITPIDFNNHDNKFLSLLDNAVKWHEILKDLPPPLLINKSEKMDVDLFDYDWESVENLIPYELNISLRPNMKNHFDYKWKDAKKQIAQQRNELTLLWNCSVAKRNKAIADGVKNWHDYMVYCRNHPGYQNDIISNILEINDPNQTNLIKPDNLDPEYIEYIPPLNKPFIVIDFETSNNLNDEFECLPDKGGQEFIFLIGITLVIPSVNLVSQSEYKYFPFLIRHLDADEELIITRKMIGLLSYLKSFVNENNENITVYHWGCAEPHFFENLIERQYDMLTAEEIDIVNTIVFDDILSVFKSQPIFIKGAYNFGLKSIGTAMYNNGMIKSTWKKKDDNGFNVMLKINEYSKDAEILDLWITDYEEVNDIIIYNMIDCQVLVEIIEFLQLKYLS